MNINQLGVQSYCFRHFKDNARVAELVRECGLNKIELCAVHVDFKAPDTFGAVIETYRAANVEIVSVGVQRIVGDDVERNFFEFAQQAAAKFMSVTFGIASVPQSYRAAEKLAQEFDMKLAIHNHGGTDWLGSAAALEHAFNLTNERIGLT